MEFKLNPYIETTYMLNAIAVVDGDRRERVRYPIKPKAVYDTKDFVEATPNIGTLVENTQVYVPYKSETLAKLKELKAPYSLQGCKTCGGAIKQIKVQVFEVL